MRRTRHAISIATLLLAATLLNGCGDSGTAATIKAIPITLTSPAIHGTTLPALYTCDGKNIPPPLTWGTLPPSVEELALFAISVTPGKTAPAESAVEWAMAGIHPALHHLAAGQIPHGAFLEKTTNGKRHYSICPTKGQTKHYEFAIYALPPHVRASPELAGTELLYNLNKPEPQYKSPANGELPATYTRP